MRLIARDPEFGGGAGDAVWTHDERERDVDRVRHGQSLARLRREGHGAAVVGALEEVAGLSPVYYLSALRTFLSTLGAGKRDEHGAPPSEVGPRWPIEQV